MRVEVNVLGTLEVTVNGASVVPTASKPRQLLAALAMNAGRLVTTKALVDELWGDNVPRSLSSTLQTHVLSVRRLIRDALPGDEKHRARELLATQHTGYLLRVEPEAVDAVRYARLAAAGRVAGAVGDYVRAEGLLSSALALWRGPVLVDVITGPQLEIESRRLSESRLTDLTLRIDADLCLGRHHQLLGDLAALSAQHPFMENFLAQYVLALYRSGRPSQALKVCHDVCATIREQLGVDPSSRLRRLHQAILTGDPVIDDPRFVVNSWLPNAIAG